MAVQDLGSRLSQKMRPSSVMEITSLSSCDSEYTRSQTRTFNNSSVKSDNCSPNFAIACGTSATGLKDASAFEAGERLASKLVKEKRLTSEQLFEIRRFFNNFDKNGDGSISLEELIAAFSAIGHGCDSKVIANLFHEADENGDGVIDYKEFVTLMAITFQNLNQTGVQAPSRKDVYREAFYLFDINKDGVIDLIDLKLLMDDIGNKLEDLEILDMIREADKNGDGVVDYEEFVEIFEKELD